MVAPDAAVATWAAENIDLGLGLGNIKPLVLGPAIVPEVTDEAEAEREMELAILSAVAHGNGPNGLVIVLAALGALGRLDQEHAAAYFQIVYHALREPVRRALEVLIMERTSEAKATFPPFAQQLIDRGIREGKLEGKLEGKREALLRLLARAGIALTEDDRARVQACTDAGTLDRWVDNVLGAKTATDVLS